MGPFPDPQNYDPATPLSWTPDGRQYDDEPKGRDMTSLRDYQHEDPRFTEAQRAAREKVWSAHKNDQPVSLSAEQTHELWVSILQQATEWRDPRESIQRAVRYLRAEGKTEEQIIDLVGEVMAENLPFTLGLTTGEEA